MRKVRRDRSPANAGKRYPPGILTGQEIATLLETCSSRSAIGLRNRAMITLLHHGLRPSEAFALHTSDLDSRAGTITARHPRGARRRTVPLDPTSLTLLARWMERRRLLGLSDDSPLFCTLRGAGLKPPYVRALLPRLAVRAGLRKRVHPDGLRHAYAAELADEGAAVSVIQARLGHESPGATSRYLRQIVREAAYKAPTVRPWTPEED
jgi:integrase/recombinase XerD